MPASDSHQSPFLFLSLFLFFLSFIFVTTLIPNFLQFYSCPCGVDTLHAVMLLFRPATFIIASVACAQAAFTSFNEYVEQYALDRGVGVDAVLRVSQNDLDRTQP